MYISASRIFNDVSWKNTEKLKVSIDFILDKMIACAKEMGEDVTQTAATESDPETTEPEVVPFIAGLDKDRNGPVNIF